MWAHKTSLRLPVTLNTFTWHCICGAVCCLSLSLQAMLNCQRLPSEIVIIETVPTPAGKLSRHFRGLILSQRQYEFSDTSKQNSSQLADMLAGRVLQPQQRLRRLNNTREDASDRGTTLTLTITKHTPFPPNRPIALKMCKVLTCFDGAMSQWAPPLLVRCLAGTCQWWSVPTCLTLVYLEAPLLAQLRRSAQSARTTSSPGPRRVPNNNRKRTCQLPDPVEHLTRSVFGVARAAGAPHGGGLKLPLFQRGGGGRVAPAAQTANEWRKPSEGGSERVRGCSPRSKGTCVLLFMRTHAWHCPLPL